jgi:phospholipid/cholesterol/gamma-HCH transport system substrate-binding protein
VLSVSIDPKELPHVYPDATAALVPNTPLKDMQIRLYPGKRGGRPLRQGATISVAETTSPVDADALLRALDSDTRTWVQTMIASLGVGLKGRKRDLNSVLRSLGPTAAQLREISGLLADRRKRIPGLVHNLRVITQATASRDTDLTRVVDAGDATLDALARNDESLKRSLELLPGTLRAARSTLGRTPPFARSLDRTLTALDPSLKALPATLRESPDSIRGIVPLPTAEVSKFIDGVAPLAKDVRPASRDLAAATPSLTKAFQVLGRTANQIAYKGRGSQSYLFWLAWFTNNANSMLSTQDAHGSTVRGFAITSCASQGASPAVTELFETVLGTPCPGGTP